MNSITLIGRLTRDPELRTFGEGEKLCRFSVAVPRRYEKDATDFFPVVAWNKNADFVVQFFKKGQRIGIVGELKNANYTDKNGIKHYADEIVANHLEFVDPKQGEPTEIENTPTPPEDDSLPA